MNEQQFLDMDDRERDAWLKETFGLEDGRIYNKGLSYEPLRVPLDHKKSHVMMQVIEKFMDGDWQVDLHLRGNYGRLCVISQDDTIHTGSHHDLNTAVYLAAGRATGAIDG